MLQVATDDHDVLQLTSVLVPAMLVGTYLNLLVSNITSGVFGGQGKPVIATILSFGLELPLSIGGVAIYILLCHGNLLGVYWWQAISGGLELVIVLYLLVRSNWTQCAQEAQDRQEASRQDEVAPTEPSSSAPASLHEPLWSENDGEDEEGADEQQPEEEA